MTDKLNPPDKNCPIHGTPMPRTGLNYTCPACVNPPKPVPVESNGVRPAPNQPAQQQRTLTDFRRWVNEVSEALGVRPPSPLV